MQLAIQQQQEERMKGGRKVLKFSRHGPVRHDIHVPGDVDVVNEDDYDVEAGKELKQDDKEEGKKPAPVFVWLLSRP